MIAIRNSHMVMLAININRHLGGGGGGELQMCIND